MCSFLRNAHDHMKLCFTTLIMTLQLVLVVISMNDNQIFIVQENILCDAL